MIKAWVFPAHAGMSRTGPHYQADQVRFPRPRGDEPAAVEKNGQTLEFSPPTRG